MSIPRLSLLLFIALLYVFYQAYNFRVDPSDFAVVHRRRINAESAKFFDFLMLTHVLEKWFPATPRFKAADARILGVGKHFQAIFQLPLIGEWSFYLATIDYKRGKLFAMQSKDGIINPRLEIRTENYHDQTLLQATMQFRKPSILFHYTVGAFLRYVTKVRFEEAMIIVEDMYKATDQYRDKFNGFMHECI